MFRSLVLRGPSAEILFVYHVAVALGAWTIAREKGTGGAPDTWRLTAAVTRVDPFQVLQAPLRFRAARRGSGFWYWPLAGRPEIHGGALSVPLGAPE